MCATYADRQVVVDCLPEKRVKWRKAGKRIATGITTGSEEWWSMWKITEGRYANDLFNVWFSYST